MLNLTEDALHLQCRATHKNEAIHIAASALEKAGYVKPGFEQAMLLREKSVSTYIGAGIALPHCAKENLDLVIQSGF